MIVGLVTTPYDDGKIAVGEGIDSDASRTEVSGKVVVVDFETIEVAEKFEAVGKAVEATETLNNSVGMLS